MTSQSFLLIIHGFYKKKKAKLRFLEELLPRVQFSVKGIWKKEVSITAFFFFQKTHWALLRKAAVPQKTHWTPHSS